MFPRIEVGMSRLTFNNVSNLFRFISVRRTWFLRFDPDLQFNDFVNICYVLKSLYVYLISKLTSKKAEVGSKFISI